jgi:hypothetical protein
MRSLLTCVTAVAAERFETRLSDPAFFPQAKEHKSTMLIEKPRVLINASIRLDKVLWLKIVASCGVEAEPRGHSEDRNRSASKQ